jgi:hypothetical protein
MTDAAKETGKKGNLVFISYASEKGDSTKSDRQVADMIYSALESRGIRGWVAHRDIAPGLNWPDEISKAISRSKVMILVLSSNTQKSRYVSMEVTQAETWPRKVFCCRTRHTPPLLRRATPLKRGI